MRQNKAELRANEVFTITHIPFNSIKVADSYDLNEDDEQQGESGSIVIEHDKPVISRRGGEAQTKQQTEQTHETCKKINLQSLTSIIQKVLNIHTHSDRLWKKIPISQTN